MRKAMRAALLFAAAVLAPLDAMAAVAATLYKDPGCGCCADYARHLERQGFAVQVVDTPDLAAVKAKHAVPADLEGCHTLLVGGYVVEGHVPVAVLQKLLAEKPAIRGIALPGMPTGSPGMGGPKTGPFVVRVIGDGPAQVYAVE